MPCRAGGRLPESLEDVRQEFRADPLAGITHNDFDLGIDPPEQRLRATALRRELDGVREEIPNDLLQTIGIARHDEGTLIKCRGDFDVLRFSRGTHYRNGRLDDRNDFNWMEIKREMARYDP